MGFPPRPRGVITLLRRAHPRSAAEPAAHGLRTVLVESPPTGGQGMARDGFTECAEAIASDPDLVRRLLAEHVPDDAGWCRRHRAHPERHPCSIRRLAELAAGQEMY